LFPEAKQRKNHQDGVLEETTEGVVTVEAPTIPKNLSTKKEMHITKQILRITRKAIKSITITAVGVEAGTEEAPQDSGIFFSSVASQVSKLSAFNLTKI
jgi:hypothetical protein